MPRFRRWWWALLLVPILLVGSFVLWAESAPSPMPEAEAAMEVPADTDGVLVTTRDWLCFRPITREPSTGLILYPGGRKDLPQ
jgi:hypothetical protein